jgi:hypothetical protein
MRDLTLKRAPERLAVEGEILVSYRFQTGSVGLASPGEIVGSKGVWGGVGGRRSWWSRWKRRINLFRQPDKTAAIRVSPTARLRVNSVPDEIQQEFGVSAIENVNFVELSAEGCYLRDAIRFRNGRHVLLQRFGEGIWFEVLADGSNDQEPNQEPEESRKLVQPPAESRGGAALLR